MHDPKDPKPPQQPAPGPDAIPPTAPPPPPDVAPEDDEDAGRRSTPPERRTERSGEHRVIPPLEGPIVIIQRDDARAHGGRSTAIRGVSSGLAVILSGPSRGG